MDYILYWFDGGAILATVSLNGYIEMQVYFDSGCWKIPLRSLEITHSSS